MAGYSVAVALSSGVEASPIYVGEIGRRLRLTISLTNPHGQELIDQVVWLYMPVSETPTQKLNTVWVSMPHETISDPLGHSILKLVFPRIAPWASKIVNVEADLTLRMEPSTPEAIFLHDWLRAEKNVELGDPNIQILARDLRRPTMRQTAQSIYDWVRHHMNYSGYNSDDRGAAYAISELQGDCTEYAYLAAALARANEIPARIVGGYVVDRDMSIRAQDYHNWTEMFFDGAWRLVDAQKEHWLTPTEQYVAFFFLRSESINPIGPGYRFRVKGQLAVHLG